MVKLFPPNIPKRKRVFDLVLIVLFSPLLIPLLLVTALLVRLMHGSPVVFAQQRAGYRGEIFTLYKFRSMSDARGTDGELLPDEQRLTAFGKFLRASSLDEFPELLNVVRGEMSLVGPRPLLIQYLPRYTPEQNRRHEVLPGISGWAQVNGRNNVSWEIKFELDVWYVDNWSLWRDVQILLMTIGKVFNREGISQPGNVTATEFMGTEEEKTPPSV
jgi:lipopolysaccharide/colanic/teichoic acid biosynthesis glycosyltransferase